MAVHNREQFEELLQSPVCFGVGFLPGGEVHALHVLQSGKVRWNNDIHGHSHVPVRSRISFASAQVPPRLVTHSEETVHVHGQLAGHR